MGRCATAQAQQQACTHLQQLQPVGIAIQELLHVAVTAGNDDVRGWLQMRPALHTVHTCTATQTGHKSDTG
jgi:hypothetical protein